MLQETGRIVAIENDALWVETIQRSVCGNCDSQKGCGQRLLSQFGAQPSYLKVLLSGRSNIKYNINDRVTIGIPETAVVKASLLIYLLPLVIFVLFSGAAQLYFQNDPLSIVAGAIGLVAGGALVRSYMFSQRNNIDFQPRVIE
jgi:sigma-E factor negative regulatory protein RseC